VILAGRRINDGMGPYVARKAVQQMIHQGRNVLGAKVNVLGLTFKENCRDIRNSKVIDVIRELEQFGCEVFVHDPEADPDDTLHEYGIRLRSWDELPAGRLPDRGGRARRVPQARDRGVEEEDRAPGLPGAGEGVPRSGAVQARRGARVEAVSLPRLRVGIFADSPHQPRWIVEALASAGASPFAEIALDLRLPQLPQLAFHVSFAAQQTGRTSWGSWGSRRRWCGEPMWRPIKRCSDVGARMEARTSPSLCHPSGGSCGREREVLAREARRCAPGCGVRAGRGRLSPRSRAWRATACGASASEMRTTRARSSRACARRSTNAPVTVSGIRIHRPGVPDRVACQSYSRTFPFSVARNRNALFAKTGEFVARALKDLHAGGARWIEVGTEPAREGRAGAFPGATGLLRDISRLGSRAWMRAKEKALTLDQWSIAYRFGTDAEFNGSLEDFFRLEPPKGLVLGRSVPDRGRGPPLHLLRGAAPGRLEGPHQRCRGRPRGPRLGAGARARARLPPLLSVPGGGGGACST
jgi:hypothetical protein